MSGAVPALAACVGDASFLSPFGERQISYYDHTASGRPLANIEEILCTRVLPFYGNTHTTSSYTGLQMAHFREEARNEIRKAVGATEMEHAVIFCGSGTTEAINKLVDVLQLRRNILSHQSCVTKSSRFYNSRDDEDGMAHYAPSVADRESVPLVCCTAYEHHSNLLPWRDSIAEVREIGLTPNGSLDLEELRTVLAETRSQYPQRLIVGAFSAASNVTGVLTDVAAVSLLVHEYDGLACFDCAACAPYVTLDMGASSMRSACYRGHCEVPKHTDRARRFVGSPYPDAICVSPHKFMGGPQTPGILVAHRRLFLNRIPGRPGGGTVDYVHSSNHFYEKAIEHREEGGTPDIIGCIRAGLVFRLKTTIGVPAITSMEERLLSAVLHVWAAHPNLVLLGPHPSVVPRLAIVSFLIRANPGGCEWPEMERVTAEASRILSGNEPDLQTTGTAPSAGALAPSFTSLVSPLGGPRYLHHNYVSTLLNDLFGIQVRSGCACAGPYGHRLLGLDDRAVAILQRTILEDRFDFHPGWTRATLHYTMTPEEIMFLVRAVDWVARLGWVLLPLYRWRPRDAKWRYAGFPVLRQRMASGPWEDEFRSDPAWNEQMRAALGPRTLTDDDDDDRLKPSDSSLVSLFSDPSLFAGPVSPPPPACPPSEATLRELHERYFAQANDLVAIMRRHSEALSLRNQPAPTSAPLLPAFGSFLADREAEPGTVLGSKLVPAANLATAVRLDPAQNETRWWMMPDEALAALLEKRN
ncbi:putative aminotransferase class V-fold PLP-dependent enzyme [Paratrimastix pyriformis]|uniref:Aminotransferase class V-fold PLP-dependent enzyme n=1 Tax=Paratrimastix pyriformis TaxID=342808 RepID=A0ABQ8UNI3_9EUKA|nr:putative aminotransferase class V-fold PLP-dependent enzyme [Paratrimastix pyriformis]